MNLVPTPARWRVRPAQLLAVAAATTLVVTLLAAPGQAAAPQLGPATGPLDQGLAGDPLQTIAQAYLTTYPDLSPAAARTAAVAQQGGEALKATLSQRWESFGGGWFDPYAATYHLAVTSPATGQALAAVGARVGVAVDTPLVDRSFDQLTAEADALRTGDSALARAAGGNVGIDVATNQVVAAVPPADLARLAGRAPAGVTVVPAEPLAVEADACTDRRNCDDFLAAGLMIRNGNPGAHVCSLGFTARNSANQRIMLTAGHCSTAVGQQWSIGQNTVRLVGSVSGRIDSGAADVTRVVVTNAFYGNVNSGRIYVSPPANWSPVIGDTFLINGDVVCLSASFPNPGRVGNPCATVTNTSDPGTRNMVRIEGYDACPGDSGGGWYWLAASGNRYAVALHSRSVSGCNAAGAVSWASPITAFYPDLRFNYETG